MEYTVMRFPELACEDLKSDYVPSKDTTKIISTTNFKLKTSTLTDIEKEVDKEFEYQIDKSPYNEIL
ncbi:hypothetical protein QTN25_002402 [Entamoeba marina]